MRILIVGASGSSHIGGSLLRAAERLGLERRFCDINEAWRHGTLVQKLLWHFGERRPARLGTFGRKVLGLCTQFRPDLLLATGTAPLSAAILQQCQRLGVRCANFSTDDPFSRVHHVGWFLHALRHYNVVFSPRRANSEELKAHGCPRVEYLPFGYDSNLFHPLADPAMPGMESDLFFAGTGDRGRVPFIAAALQAGLQVRLHGIDWGRYAETKGVSRGQADIPTMRQTIYGCRVALCLVRHENRDGHSMRSFEVPAVGACMVVEETPEHREIFGPDGKAVRYFRTPQEMVETTSWLLHQIPERKRLREKSHQHIVRGRNTYADRLSFMVEYAAHLPLADQAPV